MRAHPEESTDSASSPHPLLRPLRPDDAADVLAAFASHEDMARQGQIETLSDAEAYVARLCDPEGAHRPWAITVDDRLVGLVCVSVDEANLNGWFWYWVSYRYRRRGLAARAAASVAEWALTAGGLHRLELGHRVTNPQSGSVARAAGFVKEGTEREKFLIGDARVDVDVYSRLRTDPGPVFCPLVMKL